MKNPVKFNVDKTIYDKNILIDFIIKNKKAPNDQDDISWFRK